MSEFDEHLVSILLVDDDEEDYIITRDILSEIEDWRFDLKWVSEYDTALQVIETSRFDVCLVDYHLGARNGLELLSEVIGSGCKTPMILLTGQADREVDIQAMRAGAADYLVKGRIDSSLLERSIRYSMREQEAKEKLSQVNEMMNLVDEVARIITSTLNIDEVYEKFALEVKKLVDFDRMNVNLIDHDAEVFVVKYQAGSFNSGLPAGEMKYSMVGQVRHIVATGRTLVRSDLAQDICFPLDLEHLKLDCAPPSPYLSFPKTKLPAF